MDFKYFDSRVIQMIQKQIEGKFQLLCMQDWTWMQVKDIILTISGIEIFFLFLYRLNHWNPAP